MTTNGGALGMSNRRLGGTLALAAVCAVAMLSLLTPSGASASYARCHGGLSPDNGVNIPDPNGIDYTFSCDHIIHSFTIWSSSPVDYFGVSPLVYAGTDPSTDPVDGNASFSCEGNTPSRGFGCQGGIPPGGTAQGGTTSKNEAVQGQLVTDAKLCATKHKPRPHIFFSVTETEYLPGSPPINASSGPFRLPNGCMAANGSSKQQHHQHH